MANSDSFKSEFDSLAEDSCIGDPKGQLAYAYIRVSSEEQAVEGRSGLARQIRNIDSVAKVKSYRIPWDMVFADDYTGFEFEDRPKLTLLRKELNLPTRRANVVVMEHLDRLSRNADWHQGFLLQEMEKNSVTYVFWKGFKSRTEQAFLDSIAGAMKDELMRVLNDNSDSFKREFDKLAENGCIGDPNGQYAYAYLRDASEEQVEEGQSGLSRQLKHIHTVAVEKGYKIPWEMVFAEVCTGFEFEGRVQLTRLRNELRLDNRRSNVVVMDQLDRLSRNADWHQGFLLDEMKKNGVTPVFSKANVSLGEWLVAAFVNGGAE